MTLIEAFLHHDQGDPSATPSGRGPAARAAPVFATAVATPIGGSPPPAPSQGAPSSSPTPDGSDAECRCLAYRANRVDAAAGRGQPNNRPLPPPEYNGPGSNVSKESANRAEFEKRRTSGACFHCKLEDVDYDLFHTLCPRHGRSATAKDRRNNQLGVPGAGQRF